MEKKYITILFLTSFFLSLITLASFIIYPTIGEDSGYYLSIAREVYSGKVYFHEIGITYNPLAIILFGIPYMFSDNPDFRWHLLINYIALIGSVFILYKILSDILIPKITNLFFCALFFLLSLILDGKHLMLEPISVLFQLLSLFYYLKYLKSSSLKHFFLVGVFICLSFLSKQYGIFIVVPIGIHYLYKQKIKIKDLSIIIVGALLPLFLFFIYLNSFGFDLYSFITALAGKGIKFDKGTGTSLNTNFWSYPMDIIYIILFNLYIITIPTLLLAYYKRLDDKKIIFILAMMSSMMVLLFAAYWHYFLYIIPYTIILYAYLCHNLKSNFYKYVNYLILTFSLIIMALYSFKSLTFNNDAMNEQLKAQNVLSTVVPSGSEIYLDGLSTSHYYIGKYNSINLKKIGYTFPGYFLPKTIIDNLNHGSYAVISENKYKLYKDIINNCSIENITINKKNYLVIKKNL